MKKFVCTLLVIVLALSLSIYAVVYEAGSCDCGGTYLLVSADEEKSGPYSCPYEGSHVEYTTYYTYECNECGDSYTRTGRTTYSCGRCR